MTKAVWHSLLARAESHPAVCSSSHPGGIRAALGPRRRPRPGHRRSRTSCAYLRWSALGDSNSSCRDLISLNWAQEQEDVITMSYACREFAFQGQTHTHAHYTGGRGTHSATWMFSARTVPRTLAGRKPPETNAAVRSPPSHELALDCDGTPRHQSDSSHCLVNRPPVTQHRGPSTRGLCFYHSITSQPITRVGCSSRTKGLLSSPGAHPAQGPIVGATAVWVAGFSARHERWPR